MSWDRRTDRKRCGASFESSAVPTSRSNLIPIFRFSDFAQHVADAGCFPVLSDCLKEAELSVRKTACAAIADILKWDPEVSIFSLSKIIKSPL